MKLLFDESALRNGLAGTGDHGILDYAATHDFILVSTDSDFEGLLRHIPGAKVVTLRSCNYRRTLPPKCFGAMRSVSRTCRIPWIV
jgi:predicted nuclease of predicted toxin-antitoxin system